MEMDLLLFSGDLGRLTGQVNHLYPHHSLEIDQDHSVQVVVDSVDWVMDREDKHYLYTKEGLGGLLTTRQDKVSGLKLYLRLIRDL